MATPLTATVMVPSAVVIAPPRMPVNFFSRASKGNADIGGDRRSAARWRIGRQIRGIKGVIARKCHIEPPKKNGRPEGRPVGVIDDPKAQEVVLSNTPPLAFSLRATSAYSARICRRSQSPVLASGIEIILRPLR